MWVIIAARSIAQPAGSNQPALRNRSFPDNVLPCINRGLVWIVIEVARDAVNPYPLGNIARNNPVEIPAFNQILVNGESAFVREVKSAVDIVLNGIFVRRKSKKQFMETPDMVFGLYGPVLRQILRKGQYQGFTLVEYINFLTLGLSIAVRTPDRINGNNCTGTNKDDGEQPYHLKAALNIL